MSKAKETKDLIKLATLLHHHYIENIVKERTNLPEWEDNYAIIGQKRRTN